MLFLNFFADHETDTRTTQRFTLVGDKAADLDLKSKPVTDFFAPLAANKTVIDPTIVVLEELFVARQGVVPRSIVPLVDRLPVQTARGYRSGGLPIENAATDARYLAAFEKGLAMVKALHDRRIPLVAGTDALAGLMLHHELALFVGAGLTPAEAVRTATIIPAKVMKMAARTGSIAEGKVADLVLVDGDPLARIDDVGRVVSTVRGAVVIPSAALYATLGVNGMK